MIETVANGDWITRVVGAIRIAFLAAAGFALFAFLLQRSAVFPGASRTSPRSTSSVPENVRQIWLEASFGRVEAWLLEPAPLGEGSSSTAVAPSVVYAHGNGELIEDWYPEMEDLAGRGIRVVLVEYPGYGHSDGRPTRSTIREAYLLAHDWLTEEGGANVDHIVAYGRSIGGGAATDLARDRRVAALILQSTFTSTADMAREILLPGFLIRDRFDNVDVVSSYPGPVLLMHGRTDEVIPFRHAERLAAAREGLEITEIDCGHNDCASEWPAIVDHITAFLERHGLLDGSP